MDNKGQSEFQQNAMGGKFVGRVDSGDGSQTGTFVYLIADGAGATLTSYTIDGASQITDDWEIPAGGIFGPFNWLTQFEVGAGQVLAFEPVEFA